MLFWNLITQIYASFLHYKLHFSVGETHWLSKWRSHSLVIQHSYPSSIGYEGMYLVLVRRSLGKQLLPGKPKEIIENFVRTTKQETPWSDVSLPITNKLILIISRRKSCNSCDRKSGHVKINIGVFTFIFHSWTVLLPYSEENPSQTWRCLVLFCEQCHPPHKCNDGSALPRTSWRRLLPLHSIQWRECLWSSVEKKKKRYLYSWTFNLGQWGCEWILLAAVVKVIKLFQVQ